MKKTELAIFAVVGILAISAVWYWLEGDGEKSDGNTTAHFLRNDGSSSSGSSGFLSISQTRRDIPLNVTYRDRAGDKTDIVVGVDENHDGVRDDIEKLIEERYRSPEQRRAMMQFSRAEQTYITSSLSPGGAIENFHAVDKSMQCLRQVLGAGYMTDVHEVLALMLNTKERFQAYATADKQLAGQVYVAYRGTAPCDK
jgi:hypothetical protein